MCTINILQTSNYFSHNDPIPLTFLHFEKISLDFFFREERFYGSFIQQGNYVCAVMP